MSRFLIGGLSFRAVLACMIALPALGCGDEGGESGARGFRPGRAASAEQGRNPDREAVLERLMARLDYLCEPELPLDTGEETSLEYGRAVDQAQDALIPYREDAQRLIEQRLRANEQGTSKWTYWFQIFMHVPGDRVEGFLREIDPDRMRLPDNWAIVGALKDDQPSWGLSWVLRFIEHPDENLGSFSMTALRKYASPRASRSILNVLRDRPSSLVGLTALGGFLRSRAHQGTTDEFWGVASLLTHDDAEVSTSAYVDVLGALYVEVLVQWGAQLGIDPSKRRETIHGRLPSLDDVSAHRSLHRFLVARKNRIEWDEGLMRYVVTQ